MIDVLYSLKSPAYLNILDVFYHCIQKMNKDEKKQKISVLLRLYKTTRQTIFPSAGSIVSRGTILKQGFIQFIHRRCHRLSLGGHLHLPEALAVHADLIAPAFAAAL